MKCFFIFFIISFLFSNVLAQNNLHLSLSAGVVSSEFFMKDPLGYQLDGTILYQISNATSLIVSLGFYKFEEIYGPGGNDFRTIPLLFGSRLNFPVGITFPYLSGQLGVHFIKRDYTLETYELSNIGLFRLVTSKPATETSTKFAIRVALGITISLYQRLGLDFNIRYDNISYQYIYAYAYNIKSRNVDLYSLNLGLNYRL